MIIPNTKKKNIILVRINTLEIPYNFASYFGSKLDLEVITLMVKWHQPLSLDVKGLTPCNPFVINSNLFSKKIFKLLQVVIITVKSLKVINLILKLQKG